MTQPPEIGLPEDGLSAHLGMRVVSASADEVILEWQTGPQHLQPRGITHGGTFCVAVETACSIGATLAAMARDPGLSAVGLDNHTSFIRAVGSGRLRAIARPITRGRTTQVWRAEIRDDGERLVAMGQVRLLCVAREATLGSKG